MDRTTTTNDGRTMTPLEIELMSAIKTGGDAFVDLFRQLDGARFERKRDILDNPSYAAHNGDHAVVRYSEEQLAELKAIERSEGAAFEARRHLQTGLMWFRRAIANPEGF